MVDWELPLFSSHFDIDWSGRYLSMLDWTLLNTPCRRSSCAKHRVCAHVSTMYCSRHEVGIGLKLCVAGTRGIGTASPLLRGRRAEKKLFFSQNRGAQNTRGNSQKGEGWPSVLQLSWRTGGDDTLSRLSGALCTYIRGGLMQQH